MKLQTAIALLAAASPAAAQYDTSFPPPVCAKFKDINVAGVGEFVDVDGSGGPQTTGDMSVTFSLTGQAAPGSYPNQSVFKQISLDLNAVCFNKRDQPFAPQDAPVCFYEGELEFCRSLLVVRDEPKVERIDPSEVVNPADFFGMDGRRLVERSDAPDAESDADTGGLRRRLQGGGVFGEDAAKAATVTPGDYSCDYTKDFVKGQRYSQISLTDFCRGGVCDANPKYGEPNDPDRAVAFCKDECSRRGDGCTGFFFQKQGNGHEICGFFSKEVDRSNAIRSQPKGAVCVRKVDAVLITDEIRADNDSFIIDMLCGSKPNCYVLFPFPCIDKRSGGFTAHGTGSSNIKITGGNAALFGAFGQIITPDSGIDITSVAANGDITYNFDAGIEICYYRREDSGFF